MICKADREREGTGARKSKGEEKKKLKISEKLYKIYGSWMDDTGRRVSLESYCDWIFQNKKVAFPVKKNLLSCTCINKLG